jgi:ATP-binding cassette subfamily F protein 3
MLQFEDVALRRGPRLLFEHADFQVHPGQKVGLTGANGCGKSSLFALILNDIATDAGQIRLPERWQTAYLSQESQATEQPALEYVLDGDTGLRDLQQRLAAAEAANEGPLIGELHAQLETIGGYQANSRAAALMAGLGFGQTDLGRAVRAFSGGWRMRLNLARTLMCRSDLLLLDEPTNHLDLDAVIWLEGWLRQYRGTLLLISHDRDFLDSVCDHILHIEQRSVRLYGGNYSAFEHVRAERLANQQAGFQKQQREIAHMQAYVDRFRAKATKARQAQSRLKALQRMTRIAPAHVDSPFRFAFAAADKYPRPLLTLDGVAVGYDRKPVLEDLKLVLNPGDRIGLLGPNGAGKSTLVRVIAGMLPPMAGLRHEAQDLAIGYFAQHQVEQLHAELSPVDHLRRQDPGLSEQAARDFLGGFGFAGDKALSAVAPFSGGEKSRLVLALLVHQRPNLLMLDEPTNHLDLEMRQALANALQDFEGALILVSHDRHLLRLTTDQLLLVADGRCTTFDDALDAYPSWLTRNRQTVPAKEAAVDDSADSRKARKRAEAERRRALMPLKRALEHAEARLDAVHEAQQALELALADTRLYEAAAKEELQQLLRRKAGLDNDCETAEAAWLEAAEALEQATSHTDTTPED